MAQSNDHVQVVLTQTEQGDSSATTPLPIRILPLSKENPTVHIGRSSKRDYKLQPAPDNGWIDSAVMSREHALIKFNAEQMKVFIKDLGSLHGTFHNGFRLAKHKIQLLRDGDILKFGIALERSVQTYPACTMRVAIQPGNEIQPASKSMVFRVPDDTDVEDVSDEDCVVQNSVDILCEAGFHPAPSNGTSETRAIDLTSEGGGLDADDDIDLDGALGHSTANVDLPAGLPDLTSGAEDVGLERGKSVVEQEETVITTLAPSAQLYIDQESTIMISSDAASPPHDIEMRASSPVLDETSAYRFELSKVVATEEVIVNQSCPDVRACSEQPVDVRPSQKRKAENISESTEEQMAVEVSEDLHRYTPSPRTCIAHTRSWKAVGNEAEGSRATKRLCRAAEVFGYAALGGVAVISALIATAPAL